MATKHGTMVQKVTIAWIRYNSLNLQSKVQMSNGNKIDYRYDASGVKRQAVYSVSLSNMQIPLGDTGTENTANIRSVSTRDYCANFVYLNGQVQRILIPGGYISARNTTNTASWEYVYHLTDHLGNVRAEVKSSGGLDNTTSGLTKQTTASYYPYGQEKQFEFYTWYGGGEESPVYQFGENELDLVTLHHDFNFRWYDQQLGRFLSPDPLAALNYSISPYTYCKGNPVNYIDPWGLAEEEPKNVVELPEVVVTGKGQYDYSYYFSAGWPQWSSESEYIQNWVIPENAKKEINGFEWEKIVKEQGIEREGEMNDDGYGNTFMDRFTNPKFWKDALLGEGAFKAPSNIIQISMADNPISLLMPFGQLPKMSLGFKTLGGASKNTLVTSALFKEMGVSGSLGGSRWYTPLGSASNWETFLGRWSPFFMESGLI